MASTPDAPPDAAPLNRTLDAGAHNAASTDAGLDATADPDSGPATGAPCDDDGDPCTRDEWLSGICDHSKAAMNGTSCSGGLCYDGACCTGCWDGASCQAGTSTGACGGAGTACEVCTDDGDPCTIEQCALGDCTTVTAAPWTDCGADLQCDESLACVPVGATGERCRDGDLCDWNWTLEDGGDVCQDGYCVHEFPCGAIEGAYCCPPNGTNPEPHCVAGYCGPSGRCEPCSGRDEPCCPGSTVYYECQFNDGLVCVDGTCKCGHYRGPCCPESDGTETCDPGLSCQSIGYGGFWRTCWPP